MIKSDFPWGEKVICLGLVEPSVEWPLRVQGFFLGWGSSSKVRWWWLCDFLNILKGIGFCILIDELYVGKFSINKGVKNNQQNLQYAKGNMSAI